MKKKCYWNCRALLTRISIFSWRRFDFSKTKKFLRLLSTWLYFFMYLLFAEICWFLATLFNEKYYNSSYKAFSNYLKLNILSILSDKECVEIKEQKVTALGHILTNTCFLVEVVIKNSRGQLITKKIVGKHFGVKGTYARTLHFFVTYGKQTLAIRGIQTPQERISAELDCFQKMRGAEVEVKVPEIIYIDPRSGYIFTEYVEGINIEDIIHHILQKKLIRDWEIRLFEKMGRGLAEINLVIGLCHGDTFPTNWIYNPSTEELFMTDWECCGKGDPVYDLAKLIYDLGSFFDDINLFDKVYAAVIRGYSEIDLTNRIIKRFPMYWSHFVLTGVPLDIHERIFELHQISTPRLFNIIKHIRIPVQNKRYSVSQQKVFIDRLTFVFVKLLIKVYRLISLLIRKDNREFVEVK